MLMKTLIAAMAFAMTASMAGAQDTGEDNRVAELRERIRDLQRELSEIQSSRLRTRALVWSGDGRSLVFRARARMGIVVQTRRDEAVDSIGALVESVDEGSAAQEAGIQQGDIITSFDGDRLVGRYPPASDFESDPAVKLVDMVREHDVGDTVEVTYRRGRDTRTAQVVLQSAADWLTATLSVEPRGVFRVGPGDMDDIMIPDMGPNAFARVIVSGTSLDDMELVSLNEDLGAYFGTTEGVLVIQPGDDNLQLRGGDVILAIGDRTVDGPSRVFRILRSYEPGEEVMLTVMRNGDEITVTGTIPERNQGVYLNRRRR